MATSDAIYRVGGVMRRAPDQRWSHELIQGIKGTPAEPRPGSGSDTLPTYAKHSETDKKETYEKDDNVPIIQVRPAYIYKNDVIEHGGTEGCKACHVAMTRGNTTGYTHSPACLMRFGNIFRERGSAKLTRADERWSQAVVEQSTGVEDNAAAPEEEKMENTTAAPAPPQTEVQNQPMTISIATPPKTLPPRRTTRVRAEAARIEARNNARTRARINTGKRPADGDPNEPGEERANVYRCTEDGN